MNIITNSAASFHFAWVSALIALVSCSPADDDEKDQEVDASCDAAASHFWEVCTDFMGSDSAEMFAEGFRVDCIAMQGFYRKEARCIAESETCEDLLQCEVSAVEFICETDEECGGDLFCATPDDCAECAPDTDCVACLEDAHCSEGKLCLTGLCIDESNAFHEILQ